MARIAHAVDVPTRTMAVELDVNNEDGRLCPGTFCQVRWPIRRTGPSLFVPSSSVATTTDRTFVIRVRGGKTEWVDVKTGLTAGPLVEVFGDLEPGDEIAGRGTERHGHLGQPLRARRHRRGVPVGRRRAIRPVGGHAGPVAVRRLHPTHRRVELLRASRGDPRLARAATLAETGLALALLAGVWVRGAALGSSALLATFAVLMALADGPSRPSTTRSFSASAAALLLAERAYPARRRPHVHSNGS